MCEPSVPMPLTKVMFTDAKSTYAHFLQVNATMSRRADT